MAEERDPYAIDDEEWQQVQEELEDVVKSSLDGSRSLDETLDMDLWEPAVSTIMQSLNASLSEEAAELTQNDEEKTVEGGLSSEDADAVGVGAPNATDCHDHAEAPSRSLDFDVDKEDWAVFEREIKASAMRRVSSGQLMPPSADLSNAARSREEDVDRDGDGDEWESAVRELEESYMSEYLEVEPAAATMTTPERVSDTQPGDDDDHEEGGDHMNEEGGNHDDGEEEADEPETAPDLNESVLSVAETMVHDMMEAALGLAASEVAPCSGGLELQDEREREKKKEEGGGGGGGEVKLETEEEEYAGTGRRYEVVTDGELDAAILSTLTKTERGVDSEGEEWGEQVEADKEQDQREQEEQAEKGKEQEQREQETNAQEKQQREAADAMAPSCSSATAAAESATSTPAAESVSAVDQQQLQSLRAAVHSSREDFDQIRVSFQSQTEEMRQQLSSVAAMIAAATAAAHKKQQHQEKDEESIEKGEGKEDASARSKEMPGESVGTGDDKRATGMNVWRRAADDAKNEAAAAQAELKCLQATAAELREQLQLERQGGKETAAVAARCEDAEALVDEYQEKVMQAQVIARQGQREAEVAKEAAAAYKEEMNAYREEKNKLQEELSDTHARLDATMIDTENTKRKLGELVGVNDDLLATLRRRDEASQESERHHATAITAAEKERKTLSTRVHELEGYLHAERETWTEEREMWTEEISALKRKTKAHKKKAASAATAGEEAQRLLAERDEQIASLRTELADTGAHHAAAIQPLEDQVKELRVAVQAKDGDLLALREEERRQQQQMEELQAQLADAKEALSDSTFELKSLTKEAEEGQRSELVTLRVQTRMHQSVVDRYEARLDDLEARNRGLANELHGLRGTNEKMRSAAVDTTDLSHRVAVAENMVTLLQKENGELRARVSKEVTRRAQAESDASSFKFDAEHHRDLNHELQAELSSLRQKTREQASAGMGLDFLNAIPTSASATTGYGYNDSGATTDSGANGSSSLYSSLSSSTPYFSSSASSAPFSLFPLPPDFTTGPNHRAGADASVSELDSMRDARLAEQRAKDAERRVVRLLEQLKQYEAAAQDPGAGSTGANVVSLTTHTRLMDMAEKRAVDAERRCKELEAEKVVLDGQLDTARMLLEAAKTAPTPTAPTSRQERGEENQVEEHAVGQSATGSSHNEQTNAARTGSTSSIAAAAAAHARHQQQEQGQEKREARQEGSATDAMTDGTSKPSRKTKTRQRETKTKPKVRRKRSSTTTATTAAAASEDEKSSTKTSPKRTPGKLNASLISNATKLFQHQQPLTPQDLHRRVAVAKQQREHASSSANEMGDTTATAVSDEGSDWSESSDWSDEDGAEGEEEADDATISAAVVAARKKQAAEESSEEHNAEARVSTSNADAGAPLETLTRQFSRPNPPSRRRLPSRRRKAEVQSTSLFPDQHTATVAATAAAPAAAAEEGGRSDDGPTQGQQHGERTHERTSEATRHTEYSAGVDEGARTGDAAAERTPPQVKAKPKTKPKTKPKPKPKPKPKAKGTATAQPSGTSNC